MKSNRLNSVVFCVCFLLITTQAASATVVKVSDLDTGQGRLRSGDILYFSGTDKSTYGTELWKYDAATGNVSLVKDINPGSGNSSPQNFIEFNGAIYFVADDGVHGQEMWKSDGTAAGTMLVKDINTGIDSGASGNSLSRPVVFNGALYFGGSDVATGDGLWKTDGTEEGTVLVYDIPMYGYPQFLYVVNDMILFATNDGTHGYEWWKSDGTGPGTSMVVDLSPGIFGSVFGDIPVVMNNVLYYQGSYYNNETGEGTGSELYRTDGTEAGTYMVKNINSDPFVVNSAGGSGASQFTAIGNTLYFTAYDGVSGGNGYELWKSDGTEAGSIMVKNINPATDSSTGGPSNYADVNGTLYFSGDDGVHGKEVWKSDGTEAGTVMVKDIISGSGSSSPRYYFYHNGITYFQASDGVVGAELWQTDGTEGGTRLTQDIYSGSLSSYPEYFTPVGKELLFSSYIVDKDRALWKIIKDNGGSFHVIKASNGNVIVIKP